MGKIALSVYHRAWSKANLGDSVSVEFVEPKKILKDPSMISITLQTEFTKKAIHNDVPYDTDDMASVFLKRFLDHAFTEQQVIRMKVSNY